MPLIYIELASSLDGIRPIIDTPPVTKLADAVTVARYLAAKLPEMMTKRLEALHLYLDTPKSGIRVSVRQRSADEYVINGEDIWFRIYLSESMDTEKVRTEQKRVFKTMIMDWFTENGFLLPPNTMFDFFPGPTYGCGIVNGEVIDW